jgi:hypothetical protein
LVTEGVLTAKETGAEAVGGCSQFSSTYTLTKVLKSDGLTAIDPTIWQNIISIDAATGAIKIENYSEVNLEEFNEAQIFVSAHNSHF